MTNPTTAPISLSGSNNADVITGVGSASNRLYGLGGNDTLIGGRGSDEIYGGPGADRFVVRRRSVDRFVDFNPRQDRLLFPANEFPNIRRILNVRIPLMKWAATSTSDLIYVMGRGELHWNQNGAAPGWGTGGLIALIGRAGWIAPINIPGAAIQSVEMS